jgi:hypothetical protein
MGVKVCKKTFVGEEQLLIMKNTLANNVLEPMATYACYLKVLIRKLREEMKM